MKLFCCVALVGTVGASLLVAPTPAIAQGSGGVTWSSQLVPASSDVASVPVRPTDDWYATADGRAVPNEPTSGTGGAQPQIVDPSPITEQECKSRNSQSSTKPDAYYRNRAAHCEFYTYIAILRLPDGIPHYCYDADVVEAQSALVGAPQSFFHRLDIDNWRLDTRFESVCAQYTVYLVDGFGFSGVAYSSPIEFKYAEIVHQDTVLKPPTAATPDTYVTNVLRTRFGGYGYTPFTLRYRCDNVQAEGRTFGPNEQKEACLFPDPLPTLHYKRSTYPNVVNNIEQGLKNGAPAVLHRVWGNTTINGSNVVAQNRRAAKKICGTKPTGPTAPLDPQCDEYAFASSIEGLYRGPGFASFIPGAENTSAGGALVYFYNQDRVFGAANDQPNSGDPYTVVIDP